MVSSTTATSFIEFMLKRYRESAEFSRKTKRQNKVFLVPTLDRISENYTFTCAVHQVKCGVLQKSAPADVSLI